MKRQARNAVTIARRSHLFPYRTQKLSSLALMILGGRLPGKVGRCRLFWSYGQAVKTPPFHGGNPGSIPGRITKQTRFSIWESGFSLMGSFVPVSANMDSGAYLKNQYHAPVVELATFTSFTPAAKPLLSHLSSRSPYGSLDKSAATQRVRQHGLRRKPKKVNNICACGGIGRRARFRF